MSEYRISRQVYGEMKEFIRDNNKVGAIKCIRNQSNAGLKEAKLFVEGVAELSYDEALPCVLADGTKFLPEQESISELMGRLFELTAEISEIHRKLEGMS